MNIEIIGVLGAGVMGRGVAQALAETGHRVVLVDNAPSALDSARAEIAKKVRLGRLFRKTPDGEPPEKVTRRITFTSEPDGLSAVDFVIENVPENWAVKESVYRTLDATCPASCIFASNTSAIPITRIASVTRRADRIIGTHFMNPVPLKTTVEVIRGDRTSDETLATTRDLLTAMGKEAIVVRDSPGFVTNRVLMLTINEAVFLVQEKVAPAKDVDRLFKQCFGHKMGPLETADLIGLDTILASIEVLHECFDDDKYRPCPLLGQMVAAGKLGHKSGEGFYPYPTKP